MKTHDQSRLGIIRFASRGISVASSLAKPKRAASLILGVLVASLFLVGTPRAVAQTVTQGTPNGGFFSFSLASGASTSPVTLPLNIPWHVTAAVTTSDNEGVAEFEAITSVVGGTPILEWVGLSSPASGALGSGDSAGGTDPVVYVDYASEVVISASSTTNSFVVTNNSGQTQTGYVTWIGYSTALLEPTNTALGNYALSADISSTSSTGVYNTATGFAAGYENTTGDYNVATGAYAGFLNEKGNNNTAVGYAALYANSTNNNTAVGYAALYGNSTGTNNTATGVEALYQNVSGIGNSAYGQNALYANTGSQNTAVGQGALKANTNGGSNIAVGYQAGLNLTTGSNNIDIGSPGVAGETGVIRIGKITGTTSTQSAAYIAGVYNVTTLTSGLPVLIDSKGQLGTTSSSERFKTAITPMGSNTANLQLLRPVTFHYKGDPQETLRYGLIAEEVAKVYPELVVRDESGRIDGVRYDELAPMLLNETQQQAAEIRELTQQVARMHDALLKLQAKHERVAQR
jgi:Chaperone of endosialidase